MNGGDVIYLELPATLKYLNVLGACLAEILARAEAIVEPELTIYNMQLAAHEICTNIVDHAYRGRDDGRILIKFMLENQPLKLVMEIRDTGCTFDPAAVPHPRFDETQIRGYGLYLVNKLMDEVAYRTGPDGNHWHLVKHL